MSPHLQRRTGAKPAVLSEVFNSKNANSRLIKWDKTLLLKMHIIGKTKKSTNSNNPLN